MDTYILLQHYWWFIISLLGGLLVFLLFVQGGQGVLYAIGKTENERDMIVNTLGRKWEFTFTTLVTFGGALFASFPLFYSTSFGGAFYVWMLILLIFVIQTSGYEFRRKPDNLLGAKTYEWFLMINGVLGPLLLGVAIGTLFTGAHFTVNFDNISNFTGTGSNVISQWTTPWRGLDALADFRNILLGLAVMFLSQVLGLQYFLNSLDNENIRARSLKRLRWVSALFVASFLGFVVSLMFSSGLAVDPATGVISVEKYKYFHNFVEMPVLAVVFLAGVVSVLWGILQDLFSARKGRGIWYTGTGTVATVCSLLMIAGYNNTAYYPSIPDIQSSLTIYNSSASKFTLGVMTVVSAIIPFVVLYIWHAWRSMTRKKITSGDMDTEDVLY